jgi:predicted deacetylase
MTPTEIDDVSPGILCPEIEIYNPDVLYIIPDYNAHPISFYPKWCNYILSRNKELGLHGVKHTYKEFLYENISQEELNLGIEEFEKCFELTPKTFKPPQLAISAENKQLIKKNNLKFKGYFNQATHKVYHCSDDKMIPNRIVKIF